MTREASLPSWAKSLGKGRIEVDADLFYPEILGELEIDEKYYDQYWLEVAKSIMKMDVRISIAGTDLSPKTGGACVIHILDNSKKETGVSKWAQKAHPEGKGSVAGAKDAREHYKQLRGMVPA